MKLPWFKFYPTAWRQDPALKLCSLSARGVWVELLALMHEAHPRGHLLIAGRVPTTDDLSALLGAPSNQILDALDELEQRGVLSKTRKGVIYSRRMVRDEKASAEGRKNVAKRRDRAPAQTIEKQDKNPGPSRGAIRDPSTKMLEVRDKKEVKKDKPSLLLGACAQEAEPPPKPKRTKRSATPIPEEWAENPEKILEIESNQRAAEREGIPEQEARRETHRFVDWAKQNDKRYADWNAAWRTRCGNWRQFSGPSRSSFPSRSPTPMPGRSASLADEFARREALRQNAGAVSDGPQWGAATDAPNFQWSGLRVVGDGST